MEESSSMSETWAKTEREREREMGSDEGHGERERERARQIDKMPGRSVRRRGVGKDRKRER